MDILKGQQLLGHNGDVISADEALKDTKIICYYFSAHWCPPCKVFTPILNDFYTDLKKEGEPIEIIFVSSDKSPEDQMSYMKESHGDWLAIQHGAVLTSELKKRYEVTGIPTLIVVTNNGTVVTKGGRNDVTEKGSLVFQNWLTTSKQ